MKKKKIKSSFDRKENVQGYMFITPYLILFTIFTGIPFVIAIALSFFNVKFISNLDNVKFVGLDNFIKMFNSEEIMIALWNTVKYSLIYVPLIMVVGFFLAVILNKGIHLKKMVRTMVFVPYVSNMVAVAVIFKVLLGSTGPLVKALQSIGLDPPILLQDPKYALATISVIAVWKSVGLNMVVYLGALQGVPAEAVEAAQIDGAGKWQRIRHVIIPMVSPTTFFLVISSIITSLQNYTVIQSLTNTPGRATTVMSVSIMQTAFAKNNTSLASAQALLMFAIVMIITLVQWRGQKKWVNY